MFLMKIIGFLGIFIFLISGCASVPAPLLTKAKGKDKKIAINPSPLAITDVEEKNLTIKLRQISQLHKAGILSNAEYQQLKKKVLGKGF